LKKIEQKRFRVSAVVTSIDKDLGDPMAQAQGVACLGLVAPKVFVTGTIQPPEFPGVRWDKTASTPPVRRMLSAYLGSFSGNEVVMLTNPSVSVNPDGVQLLLEKIVAERLQMAWGASIGSDSYLMSAQVASHLWADIPENLLISGEWSKFVNDWMFRLLRHRYLDGKSYRAVTSTYIESSITHPSEAPQPSRRSKQVVKKVVRA
jgi:hypothetical protein